MPGLFETLFGRSNKGTSGSTAKARLQLVLLHDRINLPPEKMDAMKAEILQVIKKYVSVDEGGVDFALHNRERLPAIVANIPFTRPVEGQDPDEDASALGGAAKRSES
jgi:cell division topological specificity factor